eukprot:TRINITY_DN2423_c1_g1_i1.p9 TRINITY_DN2423_c1_g1~~TRINITY_DN2423_c1_g1_i1.p9  ORF type:complete len:147 (-),score=3.36 TRINITY_DN2423_c1_g1_i1:401-841(-)
MILLLRRVTKYTNLSRVMCVPCKKICFKSSKYLLTSFKDLLTYISKTTFVVSFGSVVLNQELVQLTWSLKNDFGDLNEHFVFFLGKGGTNLLDVSEKFPKCRNVLKCFGVSNNFSACTTNLNLFFLDVYQEYCLHYILMLRFFDGW